MSNNNLTTIGGLTGSVTSLSGLVNAITFVMPTWLIPQSGSILYNYVEAFCEGFAININQINELYDKTFINRATSGNLDDLIYGYINEARKPDESDEDYRERYFKYVFQYNSTNPQINEIVYDITGEYPIKILELNSRGVYWGQENTILTGSALNTVVYYDNWSQPTQYSNDLGEGNFIGYIYLNEKPSPMVLNELCKVLNSVRIYGTTIYLVYPNSDYAVYDNEEAIYDESSYS